MTTAQFLLAMLAIAQPPSQQTAPSSGRQPSLRSAQRLDLHQGTQLRDRAGGIVGTVVNSTADVVVIDTGRVQIALPLSSISLLDGMPVIAIGKSEVESMVARQTEEARSAMSDTLREGTPVMDRNGIQVGTVSAADDDFVTVASPAGQARMPIAALAPRDGALFMALTLDEFRAAVARRH